MAIGKTSLVQFGKLAIAAGALTLAILLAARLSAESPDTAPNRDAAAERWLCAGQSNAKWEFGRVFRHKDFDPSVYDALDRHQIWLTTVPRSENASGDTELPDLQRVTRTNLRGRSAFCTLFAIGRAESTGQPIEIVVAAQGGTLIETWVPKATFIEPDVFVPRHPSVSPGASFEAYVRGLAGEHFDGVVWYQGESNALEAPRYGKTYAQMLSLLIETWRDHFNSPELPFVVIQLPEFALEDQAGLPGFGDIRLQQLAVTDADPRTAIVSGLATGVADDIHPPAKHVLAARAAREAGELLNGTRTNPRLRATWRDGRLTLSAPSSCESGLQLDRAAGDEPSFQLCSPGDGRCSALESWHENGILMLETTGMLQAEDQTYEVRYGVSDLPASLVGCGDGYVFPAQIIPVPLP